MTKAGRLGIGAFFLWGALGMGLVLSSGAQVARFGAGHPAAFEAAVTVAATEGCEDCHVGIEPMHPEAELTCTDCHGGDPKAVSKAAAHVPRTRDEVSDERVLAPDEDLARRRFENPMDLRIVDRTCAECHEDAVRNFGSSLHFTTAGHLSDGFYEMGLSKEKGGRFSIFGAPHPKFGQPDEGGDVERLIPLPGFRGVGSDSELSTHFADLPRKECMQCHFWSEGQAVDGRAGFDGDYRGGGCAACHVPYALDGFSNSADRKALRNEPGHPLTHTMVRAPDTNACTTCHYGDASIGLNFRGLSQLPPGAPGGPDVAGTTDAPLNNAFYLNDPAMVPADIHFERGMHCVDCHTQGDLMGDGKLHGQMEKQVEISCEDCHGGFDEVSNLRTERGTPLENLHREENPGWYGNPDDPDQADDPDRYRVILTGKTDGVQRIVPQVRSLLDEGSLEYEFDAHQAMNSNHTNLECYTCHSAWNPNFLGFHFTRNESLSQLDLISGRRTPGRVTTQEKVFATWKSFYAGLNGSGRVAPYMTGFSTMGSVWDKDGVLKIDQAMPETAAGLSGMTMIHHQTHAVRNTARSCVECHRAPGTWGLGTDNFRLARQLAFVADERGIETVALNRGQLAASVPLAKFAIPNVTAVELVCDPLQGHAETLFVAEGFHGVHVLDARDPLKLKRLAFVATVSPRSLEVQGDVLYVADGAGGLQLFDIAEPAKIRRLGGLPMFDAHDVDVAWPWAYVADGAGGLATVDVSAPISPRLLGGLGFATRKGETDYVTHVAALFQYSRPIAELGPDGKPRASDERTEARNVAAVLDQNLGLQLVDVTEPSLPTLLWPKPVAGRSASIGGRGQTSYRGLVALSHVDVGESQGGAATAERDYLYLLAERNVRGGGRSTLFVVDITNPEQPQLTGDVRTGDGTEWLAPAQFYNPPFLSTTMLAFGSDGVRAVDVGLSKEPTELGILPGIFETFAGAVEQFPLDQMVKPDGTPLKDVSHGESRWLTGAEFGRILGVSREQLGLADEPLGTPMAPGITARLFLDQMDTDHSGALSLEECRTSLSSDVDEDENGWISLSELAAITGALAGTRTASAEERPQSLLSIQRAALTRLLRGILDGTDPEDYDRNRDLRLSRAESEQAVFGALDLDDDDRLSRDELSRLPGETRRLRYGDGIAEQLFKELGGGNGSVTAKEFELSEALFAILDADGDGEVQLLVRYDVEDVRKGLLPPKVEWLGREEVSGLPPLISLEVLLEAFDRDGDSVLTRSEMKRRVDLFLELDQNGDGRAERGEINRRVNFVVGGGVGVCADGFVVRWDLDGDGTVEEDEVPGVVYPRLVELLFGRR
ncbi:MAG: Ca2+-binding EF-hand superfamily protein [Planctomycetota bacterium]|jgi:Ca2+-binding EF-hand superfamily protein